MCLQQQRQGDAGAGAGDGKGEGEEGDGVLSKKPLSMKMNRGERTELRSKRTNQYSNSNDLATTERRQQ